MWLWNSRQPSMRPGGAEIAFVVGDPDRQIAEISSRISSGQPRFL